MFGWLRVPLLEGLKLQQFGPHDHHYINIDLLKLILGDVDGKVHRPF